MRGLISSTPCSRNTCRPELRRRRRPGSLLGRNDCGCALDPEAVPTDLRSPRRSGMVECAPLPRVGSGGCCGGLCRCRDKQATSGPSVWPSVLGLGQPGDRDRTLLVGSPLLAARGRTLATTLPRRARHRGLLGRPRCVCVVLLLLDSHLRQSPVWDDRRGLYSSHMVHRNGCSDHLGRSGRTHLGDPQTAVCERGARRPSPHEW